MINALTFCSRFWLTNLVLGLLWVGTNHCHRYTVRCSWERFSGVFFVIQLTCFFFICHIFWDSMSKARTCQFKRSSTSQRNIQYGRSCVRFHKVSLMHFFKIQHNLYRSVQFIRSYASHILDGLH